MQKNIITLEIKKSSQSVFVDVWPDALQEKIKYSLEGQGTNSTPPGIRFWNTCLLFYLFILIYSSFCYFRCVYYMFKWVGWVVYCCLYVYVNKKQQQLWICLLKCMLSVFWVHNHFQKKDTECFALLEIQALSSGCSKLCLHFLFILFKRFWGYIRIHYFKWQYKILTFAGRRF